jgi:heme exporter protein B
MSLISIARSLFLREVRLAGRIGGGGATSLLFFFVLITLVPFAVGPDLGTLARIGPAMLWIAALLATLLGLDRLFQADEEDGSLDLLMGTEAPLELLVVVKCLAHWTVVCLPLVVAAPVFGFMLALDHKAAAGVAASLLVGTPALSLLGGIGAALTATLRRGGLLGAVVVLPLCAPVLIFGVSAASAASGVGDAAGFLTPFLFLCAMSLACVAGAPFAASAALRHLRD